MQENPCSTKRSHFDIAFVSQIDGGGIEAVHNDAASTVTEEHIESASSLNIDILINEDVVLMQLLLIEVLADKVEWCIIVPYAEIEPAYLLIEQGSYIFFIRPFLSPLLTKRCWLIASQLSQYDT